MVFTRASILLFIVAIPGIFCKGRIIGGEDAPESGIPYQVSVQYTSGGHYCGGSIIDEYWILTAAHCLYGYNPLYIQVVAGTNEWENPPDELIYEPDEFIIHCQYEKPYPHHNDIGLIRLKKPLKFSERINKIELASEPLKDGDVLQISGWGFIENDGSEVPYPKLQMLNVNFLPYQQCTSALSGSPYMDYSQICTFNRKEQGVCFGDSGGPISMNGKLYGVVSWGQPCGRGYPDMYSSVLYYRDFIRKYIQGCSWYN